jgi:aminomethyltransferase
MYLEPVMKKTALYDQHVKHGARMVEFAGYAMPVQYRGIREEHRRVRTTVGVFDVSHMGEIEIGGEKALAMVQKITINDAATLAVGQVQYSAMCYDDGGIVDDLLVYRFADHYLLVVNAANKDKDVQWILNHQLQDCQIKDISDEISQIAVQGKDAEPTLHKLSEVNLAAIKYYWFTEGNLAGVPMIISRTGYTGEPGFELYFENKFADRVWEQVLAAGAEFQIEPIGLGARDSLRLEKKMCLYGNDIDQTTNPLEAGLGWITKLEKENFIGKPALLKVKAAGLSRKLIAFVLRDNGFPRHGYEIYKNGQKVGQVTSGTVSPILEKGIGLGYVPINYSQIGTEIDIKIRDKFLPAQIVKTPFV